MFSYIPTDVREVGYRPFCMTNIDKHLTCIMGSGQKFCSKSDIVYELDIIQNQGSNVLFPSHPIATKQTWK